MTGDIKLSLLARARIASPCPATWEDMTGDDKVRYCARCSLHVHNLSAMSAAEAGDLLARHFAPDGSPISDRFCGAFFKRPDGTILTRDCPVGLARVRIAARKTLARIAAAFGLLTGIGAALAWTQRGGMDDVQPGRLRGLEPLATLSRWMAPHSLPPLPTRRLIMGDLAGRISITPPPAPISPSGTPGGAP